MSWCRIGMSDEVDCTEPVGCNDVPDFQFMCHIEPGILRTPWGRGVCINIRPVR